MSPRLRRLGARDGFPRVPDVDFTLHAPARAVLRRADALADRLAHSLRAWRAARDCARRN